MDQACVIATPALTANHVDAALIHEAAIGKIAGEQLIKLMTLGRTEKEADLRTIVANDEAAWCFNIYIDFAIRL